MCTKNSKRTISLLLGAGFSAPMGYPIGAQLGDKIRNIDSYSFYVDETNTLRFGENASMGEYSGQRYFKWLKYLINEYATKHGGSFDYEQFYDYLTEKFDDSIEKSFKEQHPNEPLNIYSFTEQSRYIYEQVVKFFLRDAKGRFDYSDWNNFDDVVKYEQFISMLTVFLHDSIVNVHTLNHDLLFEGIAKSNKLKEFYCDGFSELGSPFYRKIYTNNKWLACRVSSYQNLYNKDLRLYKLHGSIDYYPNTINQTTLNGICVKSTNGETNFRIKKEVLRRGFYNYEDAGIWYTPTFLTGVHTKINKYKETLYNHLMNQFEKNLKKADLLIIIGYGCKDSKINEFIKKNFSKENDCFIVDKNPNIVMDFQQETGIKAQYIDGLENISEILKNINQNIV